MPARRQRTPVPSPRGSHSPQQADAAWDSISDYEMNGDFPVIVDWEPQPEPNRPPRARRPQPRVQTAAERARAARLLEEEQRATQEFNREVRRVVGNGRPLRVSAAEVSALRLTDSEQEWLRRKMPARESGTAMWLYNEAYAARLKVRDYRDHVRREAALEENERRAADALRRRQADAAREAQARERVRASNAAANLLALSRKFK